LFPVAETIESVEQAVVIIVEWGLPEGVEDCGGVFETEGFVAGK